MPIPFIEPAVNAVKKWADLGGSRSDAGVGSPFKRQRLSFDEQYPRLSNPLKLNDQQRLDLMPQLGLGSVDKNEVDLAVSRIPAEIDHTKIPSFVSAVIRHWREEHPNDSDAAATRKLLEGSSSLAAIDSKLDAARLAAEQAEVEHRAL